MQWITQVVQDAGRWLLLKRVRQAGLRYLRMSAYNFTSVFLTHSVEDGDCQLIDMGAISSKHSGCLVPWPHPTSSSLRPSYFTVVALSLKLTFHDLYRRVYNYPADSISMLSRSGKME